jgi:hypothetical protein
LTRKKKKKTRTFFYPYGQGLTETGATLQLFAFQRTSLKPKKDAAKKSGPTGFLRAVFFAYGEERFNNPRMDLISTRTHKTVFSPLHTALFKKIYQRDMEFCWLETLFPLKRIFSKISEFTNI